MGFASSMASSTRLLAWHGGSYGRVVLIFQDDMANELTSAVFTHYFCYLYNGFLYGLRVTCPGPRRSAVLQNGK